MGFTFPGNPFSSPGPLVPLIMFLWIPIVIYIFSRFPARRAVVISFVAGWLLLPVAQLSLPGLPEYNKMSVTCYGILLATFIFDVGRFSLFRFSWIDIPMAMWCTVPFFSSVTNGLGPYDGLTAVLTQTMTWGVPYFLGRIYMNTLAGMQELVKGIFIGGLVYMPLCLFEARLSPQLHRIVYGGAAGADFAQSIRLGGYRPSVFMAHGLELGAFMMAASLIGIWLWQTHAVRKVWGYPIIWLAIPLFITFILVRSTGAYTLIAIGLALLLTGKWFRTALPIFLLIGFIFAYLILSAETRLYITDQLVEFLSQIYPEDRMASLIFRFNNEELLVDKARQQILFGWGGWGRALVEVGDSGAMTVQDSLWIIAFGHNGTVGLFSLFSAMLVPPFALFWSRYPARMWTHPKVAPAAVMAVVIILYMMDCVMNAMVNPIYILACGGIAGLVLKNEKVRKGVRQAIPTRRTRYLMPQ